MAESPNAVQQSLPLANLIIAGVNRSATTSLFTYLSDHPEVCASTIKETNYFLPAMTGSALEPIETYADYFKRYQKQQYRMEASPRYIFGGIKVAEAIYQHLGPIRIMFVLRDPITRMISYFHQRKRSGELQPTLTIDDYARRGLDELSGISTTSNGKPIDVYRTSIFVRGLAQGFYSDYLAEWYRVFPQSIHITFFEDISSNPRSVVEEVCGYLGLDTSVYAGVEFTQENRTVKHKNSALYSVATKINDAFEPFWRKHKNAKRWLRDLYLRMNEDRPADPPLSKDLRAELEGAYASHNQQLRELLGQKGYGKLPAWLTRSAEN